jgi:hypothetical protein
MWTLFGPVVFPVGRPTAEQGVDLDGIHHRAIGRPLEGHAGRPQQPLDLIGGNERSLHLVAQRRGIDPKHRAAQPLHEEGALQRQREVYLGAASHGRSSALNRLGGRTFPAKGAA